MKLASTPVAPPRVPVVAQRLTAAETPSERRDQYSRVMSLAMAFLESRIVSGDPAAAERAVTMLFDLEKTRLRHAREIHGVPKAEREGGLPPIEECVSAGAPVVRSLRDRIDDSGDGGLPSTVASVPEAPPSSTHPGTRPREDAPVVRSLRDRIDDAPDGKESPKSSKPPAPQSPSGHGVTGPRKGPDHSTLRILKRRLAEQFPGREWSDAELARMLDQLTILHRESTTDRR